MDTALPDYDKLQLAKRSRELQAPSPEVPIVGVAIRMEVETFQNVLAA